MKQADEQQTNDRETIAWLFSIFRSTLPLLIIASIGQTVSSGLGVWTAFGSRSVVDAATSGARDEFVRSAVFLFVLILGAITVSIINHAIIERLRARSGVALQARAFGTLIRKDYMATTSRHSGDALNRLTSDVKVVCDGASTIAPTLVALISRLLFAFAALCYFDARLACIFLSVGVFIFLFTAVFRKRLKALHKAVQKAEGKKRAFWQEALENLFVVKAFQREPEIEERSNELLDAHFKATMKRRNFGLLASGGFNTLFSLNYFGALAWQAWLVLIGESTFGAMTAVLQLVGKVQSPFAGLSGLVPKYYNALASAERLRELENLPDEAGVDVEPYSAEALANEAEAIVFDGVTFRYDREGKQVDVLEDASFEIPLGKNVVVSGRSGIGKSTLFKLLSGVCRPNAGRIYLRTRTLGDIPVDRRTRALFAIVPQGNMLFSGTIAENITFFRGGAGEAKLREAARLARAEFIDEAPGAFDAALGEKGAGFSEGQIQRLAIARAANSDAPVLLLDEATSALDATAERDALDRLTKDSQKTLIIVSHRPAAFNVADMEATFVDGRVVVEERSQAR